MEYIPIISLIATIVVGFILSKQIKSQKEQLKNYEDYIKAIDWRIIKEQYEEFYIPTAIRKEREENIKLIQEGLQEGFDKWANESKIPKQFIELARFVSITLKSVAEKDRSVVIKIIKSYLPNCESLFPELSETPSTSLHSHDQKNNVQEK
jgi:hypothetical protein